MKIHLAKYISFHYWLEALAITQVNKTPNIPKSNVTWIAWCTSARQAETIDCDNDIINLPIDWLKLNEKCANLGFSPLTDDELREINMHIGAYKGLYDDGPKSEDHSEFVDTNLCKHTTSSIPLGLCNGTASWHQSINDASHITIRYLQTSLIQTYGSIAKSSHQKSYKKSLSLGAFCQTTTLNLVAYACIRCSTSKADRRRLLELNYGRGTWSQIQNKSDSDFDIDERTQRMLEKADRKADRV